MSVIVFGHSDHAQRVCAGIISYNQLCAAKDESSLEVITQRFTLSFHRSEYT
jgi:hypothetical protein